LVEVDLSIPPAVSVEDNPVDEARTSVSPTGASDRPPSHGDTTSDSVPVGMIACAALTGPSESASDIRSGSIVATGCKVTGETSASVVTGDTETAVAEAGVEADGVLEPAATTVCDTGRAASTGVEEADGSPGIMASFPHEEVGAAAAGVRGDAATATVGGTGGAVAKGEVEADSSPGPVTPFPPEEGDATAPTAVAEKVGEAAGVAATPDDRIGITGRTAFPRGTVSDNTGSGRVLPCMKVRTREGCEVRGVT
jgi:hypothetical protein